MGMKEILAGLRCYGRAHRLIVAHKLWRLILIPGVLSLLYFPLVTMVTFYGLRPVTRYVHENWIPAFLQSDLMLFFVSMVVWIAGLYLGFLLFRNVIMILCSPLLSYLSETVERVSGGMAAPTFTWKGVGREVLRAAILSFLGLLTSLVAFILCLVVSVVPVLGTVVAFFLMTLTQAYLAGEGFADPVLERRRKTVPATLRFTRQHRPRLVGVGFGFLILLAIPVVGWFIAPSYGIVAGTLAAMDLLKENDEENLPPPVAP
jgi:CysZ protein